MFMKGQDHYQNFGSVISVKTARTPPLPFKSDSHIIFMQINIQSMTFVCFIIASISFIATDPIPP